MASELKKALMSGQEMTSAEANKTILKMREQVYNGKNPEDLLYEYNLESDYIYDIM